MRVWIFLVTAICAAGCAPPSAELAGIPTGGPVCPRAGLVTFWERDDGVHGRTDWLGADPGDPDICLVNNPSSRRRGRPERRLLNWFNSEGLVVTPDERAALERSLKAFFTDGATQVSFVTRYDNVQQVSNISVIGREVLNIGGTPISTVRIRANWINGANSRSYWNEAWLDPVSRLIVRTVRSPEWRGYHRLQVTRIADRARRAARAAEPDESLAADGASPSPAASSAAVPLPPEAGRPAPAPPAPSTTGTLPGSGPPLSPEG